MFRPFYVVVALLSALFISCNRTSSNSTEHSTNSYGLLLYSDEESKEYFVQTSSLMGESYAIPKDLNEVHPIIFASKNGKYYGIDENKRDLIRYQPKDNDLVLDKVCSLDTIPWKYFSSWYNWVSEDTLLLGSTLEGSQFTYSLIDVKTMTVAKHGSFDIPLPVKPEYYGGVFARLRDNRLYIAYTLYQGTQSMLPARDTTYLAVVDYPSMKTLHIQKDTRSTWPGGYFLHAPFSLSHNGDIYFLTQPGGRTHNHPTKFTGIYRIKKDEDRLDSTYFFSPTEKQKQEGYLLYDLGNGKALIKMVEKKRVNRYMDYLQKRVVDYYVVDLIKQTKTKLDLPLDLLAFEDNVLVENDLLYIAVSTAKNQCSIWQYHIPSGKLTKGLSFNGRVFMMTRLR